MIIESITAKRIFNQNSSIKIKGEISKPSFPASGHIYFNLKDENRLSISAEKSKFNLLCLPVDNFPNFSDNFSNDGISLNRKDFLSLLSKTKISMSNDETRHYLNGIYIHNIELNGKLYLTGVATDSHRLSSSSMLLDNNSKFKSFISVSYTHLTLPTKRIV